MNFTEQTVTSKAGVQKIGKQVSNKLPKVKDASINMRDRLNDALTCEKHMLIGYQTGLNEVICPRLRQVVTENRANLQGLQVRLFSELFELGEYQANIATPQEIADTLDVFAGYKSQLPQLQ